MFRKLFFVRWSEVLITRVEFEDFESLEFDGTIFKGCVIDKEVKKKIN